MGFQEQDEAPPIPQILPRRVRQVAHRNIRHLRQEQDGEIRQAVSAVYSGIATGADCELPRHSPKVQKHYRELGKVKTKVLWYSSSAANGLHRKLVCRKMRFWQK